MRLNRYSPRTEQVYVDWIKRFIRFHGVRHPQEIGPDEVKAFLSHLATQMNVAASTQNQAFSALLFLCQKVLKERLPWIDDIVRANTNRRRHLICSEIGSVCARSSTKQGRKCCDLKPLATIRAKLVQSDEILSCPDDFRNSKRIGLRMPNGHAGFTRDAVIHVFENVPYVTQRHERTDAFCEP